jgi:hypothetical protein
MSIDLDIAPLRATPVTWGALRARWGERLGDRAFLIGPGIARRLGIGTVFDDGDALSPSSPVIFELATANTLSLTSMRNQGNLDEREYLEDYGRNLSPAEITRLADAWRDVGVSYGLSSGGGRSSDEPSLLIALACAVGDLCDGRIIVMNDGVFDLGVGVYEPAQFALARWRAGG